MFLARDSHKDARTRKIIIIRPRPRPRPRSECIIKPLYFIYNHYYTVKYDIIAVAIERPAAADLREPHFPPSFSSRSSRRSHRSRSSRSSRSSRYQAPLPPPAHPVSFHVGYNAVGGARVFNAICPAAAAAPLFLSFRPKYGIRRSATVIITRNR